MRKIAAVIAVACALGAYAEERTVSTAADLVAVLARSGWLFVQHLVVGSDKEIKKW